MTFEADQRIAVGNCFILTMKKMASYSGSLLTPISDFAGDRCIETKLHDKRKINKTWIFLSYLFKWRLFQILKNLLKNLDTSSSFDIRRYFLDLDIFHLNLA